MEKEFDLDGMGFGKPKNNVVARHLGKVLCWTTALVITFLVGLIGVQLMRLSFANDEAAEIAARVDAFLGCGEFESFTVCVDRAVARDPQKAWSRLETVRNFLVWREDPMTFAPANERYEGAGFPVTSLRVQREQLERSLAEYVKPRPQSKAIQSAPGDKA
jgi:hypothetical protein